MFKKKSDTKILNQILDLKKNIEILSDEQLKEKTNYFKNKIKAGKTLDDILPEVFATVREVSKRTIGLEHYPVQLLGGIVLHKGYIAEMKTGEGKTIVSTCPAYLNALTERPVHIVTVNDYLAKRDAELNQPIYEALGMTVGFVISKMSPSERKAAYNCDIVYVTNNELGFDYLRDNLVINKENKVLRGLDFCIIDEVDSVLIDEARTPLIISGQSEKSTSLYLAADLLAKKMIKGKNQNFSKIDAIMGEEIEEDGDFVIDEKDKTVHLTEQGVKKTEEFFHITNLADAENIDIQHHINVALKANYLMFKDKDYMVKENEILIVDEFTGRAMPGRRYSDGLHQAIEAKEHLDIKKESKTYATITFQNFFNKFKKKAGMTGTAKTEEKEFKNIYNMPVVQIPTNKPVIRIDHEDFVYRTQKEKYEAIVKEIKDSYKKGQPVLVGTISIEKSEMLSNMLKKEGIPHNVLNAKYIEKEAEIVANAGIHNSVTIATNMAGRGTDIKLDEKSKKLGGLKIIGTERHESRRIDNQLRGRSGRQGDPGESRFYLSLEDDLMRLFGSEKFIELFKDIGLEDGEEIKHPMLTKTIENAQKKIENNHYGVREQLMKYDAINNEQRELIYSERDYILDTEDISNVIIGMIKSQVNKIIDSYTEKRKMDNIEDCLKEIKYLIPCNINKSELETLKIKEFKDKLENIVVSFYNTLRTENGIDDFSKIEHSVILNVMDRKWTNHIDNLEKLRESIGLQAYGQKNPVIEYKIIAYEMFGTMINEIQEETVKILNHLKIIKE